MTTLELLSDDLIGSYAEPRLSFFDWILHVHAGLRHAHALHASCKRRIHLPTPDRARLRLRREHAPRKAENRWA